MTDLSRKILSDYQVRKTKRQKLAFIQLLKQYFPALTVQEGGFPRCRNIIVGDLEKAKIVLSAHFDTCARLPFPNFIAPKNPLLSISYSILVILPVLLAACLFDLLLGLFIADFGVHYLVSLVANFVILSLVFAGPANKHTANDNTSGVIVLCELLSILDSTQREKVAFVFFDHEETGLIGSAYFRSKYKTQMKNKLLVNFDCVSDGDHIFIAANKSARSEYGDLLKRSFLPTPKKSILFSNAEKVYYPSDQLGFKKSVAVAALKHKRFLGYYMNRIHTARDTVFDKANIKLLCESILNLLKSL